MSYGAIDAGATSRAGEGGAGVARAGDQRSGGGYRFGARFWSVTARQAYRYLEEAQAVAPAPVVAEGSATIPLNIPSNLVRELRVYSASNGLTPSETVRLAISASCRQRADMAERRSKRDVHLEYSFDRLLVAKLEQVYQIPRP